MFPYWVHSFKFQSVFTFPIWICSLPGVFFLQGLHYHPWVLPEVCEVACEFSLDCGTSHLDWRATCARLLHALHGGTLREDISIEWRPNRIKKIDTWCSAIILADFHVSKFSLGLVVFLRFRFREMGAAPIGLPRIDRRASWPPHFGAPQELDCLFHGQFQNKMDDLGLQAPPHFRKPIVCIFVLYYVYIYIEWASARVPPTPITSLEGKDKAVALAWGRWPAGSGVRKKPLEGFGGFSGESYWLRLEGQEKAVDVALVRWARVKQQKKNAQKTLGKR